MTSRGIYYRPSGYHERTEATSPCESERCPYCLEVFWPDLHDHPEDWAPFCGAQCKREWERGLFQEEE